MAAAAYSRRISFAQYSAENPTAQQSGTSLDSEFNAVKISLDSTQGILAGITDDDGVIARGSIGKAQFDSSVSIGFAAPVQWATGLVFTAEVSTCFYLSQFFICTVTHTAGASFDPAKWSLIADFTLAAVIPDGSITSAKLAAGAVAANALAAGSVSNAKIATGAVDANKIAANAVTYSKFLTTDIQGPLANLLLPVGLGPLPWHLPSLPAQGGWDWADGGVLLSNTLFPVLRQALIDASFPFGQDGSGNPFKPDARGRVIACVDDLGAGAAGRLTSTTVSGGALLGKTGGSETVTLTLSQIPTGITSSGSGSVSVTSAARVLQFNGGAPTTVAAPGTPAAVAYVTATDAVLASSGTATSVASTSNNTGGTAHVNVQPLLVCKMVIKAH